MAGYGDDTGLDAWLADYGYAWPSDGITKAVGRQRGSAYVDGLYGLRFPGTPTGGAAQERAWPRTGATTTYGAALPSDEVPAAVEQASYAAAWYEAQNPGGLAIASTGQGAIKREKVGPIETEYFEGATTATVNGTPALSEVEGLLAPILGAANFPYPLVV